MFTLMELRAADTPVNKPSARPAQFSPMRVNRRFVSDQTHQAPYDPPRSGDFVSRLGTHEVITTIAIDPILSVARWPNLPTINPTRTPRPTMPRGRHTPNTPGRKNIARRGDQSYGSLSQLYPMIDTVVV